jgi:asparagine synthase (glutamine-hydrolysing)
MGTRTNGDPTLINMCGISGMWNFDGQKVNSEELDRFTDSLRHRGPDGRGTYIDKKAGLGLGHRRLSILDLTDSGHQPMSYGDGKYWITYNGEIYNFIELRKELEGLGHRFRSESDTEIILSAYAQWGEACQFKFNGMWSFAIWDSEEKKLFLSRDRFGVKPLFYLYDDKHFLFASELKAFNALPSRMKPDFDLGIVAHFANDESAKKTVLKGVKNLNGGFQLILRQDKSPIIKRWWSTIDHLMDVPNSFEEQLEQYKELFLDACKIRMRSDVPIGTALSGGLDSSAVLCSMAHIRSEESDKTRLAKDWQKAFVLDYAGTRNSEKIYAQKVINHTNAVPVHKEISLSNISADDIFQATFSLEAVQEPSVGAWYIYREMRKNGVVVSMDGHGGDETLAGYHLYPVVALRDAVWPWQNNGRFEDVQETLKGLYDQEVPDGFDDVVVPSRWEVMKSMLMVKQGLKRPLVRLLEKNLGLYNSIYPVYKRIKSTKQNTRWTLIDRENQQPNRELRLSSRRFDHLNQKLYHDFHIHFLPRILRNFDRVSMAHGVEIRAPFLDWRLVTYIFSLPSKVKLGNGFTKYILRESMRDILPESIRLRKSKIGFASPMIEWYKNSLKTFVLDSVNSQEFLESEIWNGHVIRDYVDECYRLEDYRAAVESWKYIQTMILMKSFREMASSYPIN